MQPQKKASEVHWADLSSDSEDSWLNDDSDSSVEEKVTPNSTEKQPAKQPEQIKQDDTQKGVQKQQEKQPRVQRPAKKYPTDQEILESLKSGQIEQDKMIKAINCYNKDEHAAFDQNEGVLRKKQYKENCFILAFKSKEDLVKFIEQKIEKKYRFKLGIFVKSDKPRPQREKKQGQTYKGKPRENKEPRQYREKESKQYRQKGSQNYREKDEKGEHKQKKDHHNRPKQTEDNRHHREPKREDSFKIEKDSNKIELLSNAESADSLIAVLKKMGINKKFSRIVILTEIRFLPYADKIAAACWKEFNFGLEEEIYESKYKNPTQKIELSIKEKVQPRKIHFNVFAIASEISIEQCFSKCGQKNQYVIGKCDGEEEVKFSEKDYFEQFKKNYGVISKKWKIWTIKAYKKNIEKILKLSWVFSKGLQKHDINIRVGQQNSVPFAKLQISNFTDDLPKARGKPDTSAVHSHLNA